LTKTPENLIFSNVEGRRKGRRTPEERPEMARIVKKMGGTGSRMREKGNTYQ